MYLLKLSFWIYYKWYSKNSVKKEICIIFWYHLGNQITTKPFCQGNSTVVSSSVLNKIKWPWPYFEIYSFDLDLSLIVDAIKTSSK